MKQGILFLATLLLTFNISFAHNSGDIELNKAIKKSAIIFCGKLLKKEIKVTDIDAPKIQTTQQYIRTVYTFEVEEIYKGKKEYKTIQITTQYKDFDFNVGSRYLVYSYYSNYLMTSNFYLNGERVNPFLATDKKNRTKKMAKMERKELKKLKRLARKRRKQRS